MGGSGFWACSSRAGMTAGAPRATAAASAEEAAWGHPGSCTFPARRRHVSGLGACMSARLAFTLQRRVRGGVFPGQTARPSLIARGTRRPREATRERG